MKIDIFFIEKSNFLELSVICWNPASRSDISVSFIDKNKSIEVAYMRLAYK